MNSNLQKSTQQNNKTINLHTNYQQITKTIIIKKTKTKTFNLQINTDEQTLLQYINCPHNNLTSTYIMNIKLFKNNTCKHCTNFEYCKEYLNQIKNQHLNQQQSTAHNNKLTNYKPNKIYNHQQTLKLSSQLIIKTSKSKLDKSKYNNVPTLKLEL